MLRTLLVVFLLLPVAAQECDIGDLGDFVVTHELTVVNESDVNVVVAVTTQDVSRSAFLAARGGSVQVTSFAPGFFDVSVSADPAMVARLTQDRDAVIDKLRQRSGTPADWQTLMTNYLRNMVALSRRMTAEFSGASCGGDLQVREGKGQKRSIRIEGGATGVDVRCG